jgi:hypothetical protein
MYRLDGDLIDAIDGARGFIWNVLVESRPTGILFGDLINAKLPELQS